MGGNPADMDKKPWEEQLPHGIRNTRGLESDLNISDDERKVLRELAKRVAELAARPIEDEKKKLWTKHNDLEQTRPLIFISPENGWNEIITAEQLQCETPIARTWEMELRKEIFWGEELKDDRVITPYFDISYNYDDGNYGLEPKKTRTSKDGAFKFVPPIKNYEEDFPKLQLPELEVDFESTEKIFNLAQDTFGDILKVRLRGIWWDTLGMTVDYMSLRGLDKFMFDLCERPEWVHKTMEFLRDSVMKKLDYLEDNGLLGLNTGGSYVGSGGFGWTNELPQDDFDSGEVRTMDMWGFAESQETVGISPQMFAEFIFPYQKPILERFGLNCYGCCEPLNQRWETVKEIPRLRRVSVSDWADLEQMAEYLGQDYIYSWKPSPTPLSRSNIREEVVRQDLREALTAAKDNHLEIIMKDNHTLGNNPNNAVRWVEIAREEIKNL